MIDAQTLLDEISALTRKMRTIFDARVRKLDLSLARARILLNLRTSGSGETQKALAEALEIEGPTLVRVLDSLEQMDAIKRIAVQGDRRAKRIVLTSQGEIKASAIGDMLLAFRAEVLDGIEEADIEIARRVVRRMQANLEHKA